MGRVAHGAVQAGTARGRTLWAMDTTALPALPVFLARLLTSCLDIRAVWSMGHGGACVGGDALLVFADHATLRRLRACPDLHDGHMEVLVVVDGDAFEAAWSSRARSGSLARSAWREESPALAYYDESRWMEPEGCVGDGVERVRRHAIRLWSRGT